MSVVHYQCLMFTQRGSDTRLPQFNKLLRLSERHSSSLADKL